MDNNKRKNALINLVLTVILLAVLFGWTMPVQGEISSEREDLNARIAEKTDLQERLNELKGAEGDLSGATEIQRSRVLDTIPLRMEQDELIKQLYEIADDHQVTINSVSFGIPINSQDGIKTSTVNLSLSAEKQDLLTFLADIETNTRKLVVNSITVQYGEVEGIERINFNLSMETYFQEGI